MSFDMISRKFAAKPLQCSPVWEEGGDCPLCKARESVVVAFPEGCCSCHKNPPCGWCTSSFLECAECKENDRD